MKVERWVFGGLALFFLIMTPVYWFSSHELVGTWALGLSGAMGVLIYFYVRVLSGKIDRQPFDDPDAEVVDGAGTVGFFPPHSIWPFWTALTLSVICLGPPFGWWISLLGVGMGIWAVSGWCYEYYRGDYAH